MILPKLKVYKVRYVKFKIGKITFCEMLKIIKTTEPKRFVIPNKSIHIKIFGRNSNLG